MSHEPPDEFELPELPIDRAPTEEEQVAAQTALICRQHRDVPRERAAAVFHRLAAHGWFTFDPYGGRDSFASAVAFLGAEAALELFEHGNLDELRERISLYAGLHHLASAVYSLDELAARTERLITTLELSRATLLATGYPARPISPFHLPDRACQVHLPVKRYLTVHRRRSSSGAEVLDYEWPAFAPDSVPSSSEGETILGARREFWLNSRGEYLLDDETVVKAVPYADAALIGGLPPDDAARLEDLRQPFLDVKLAILRELASDARRRHADAPWRNSLILLANALSDEDAEFLFRMDRFYLGQDIQGLNAPQVAAALSPGGLTELLALIGHFEEELSVGLLASARAMLDPLVEPSAHGRLRYFHFFEAMRSTDRSLVETTLSRFLEREKEAQDFYQDFQQRAVAALESEFRVTIVTTIKKKYAHAFRSFLGEARAHYEGADPIPLLAGSALVVPERPCGRNSLKHAGPGWVLRFEGRDFSARNSTGLHFLHYLIVHRNEWIPAKKLDRQDGKPLEGRADRTEQQARMRITNALRRALDPLKKEPSTARIWSHFANEVERGAEFCYHAPDDSAWEA